jgi:hypothetical protein
MELAMAKDFDDGPVAKYPKTAYHNFRLCGPSPEWEFQFESHEIYFWLCLGCNTEVHTDINGNVLKINTL